MSKSFREQDGRVKEGGWAGGRGSDEEGGGARDGGREGETITAVMVTYCEVN